MICGICQHGNYELEALVIHIFQVHKCPGFVHPWSGNQIGCPSIYHQRIVVQPGSPFLPRLAYCQPSHYNVRYAQEVFLKCANCPELRIRTYKDYAAHVLNHYAEMGK